MTLKPNCYEKLHRNRIFRKCPAGPQSRAGAYNNDYKREYVDISAQATDRNTAATSPRHTDDSVGSSISRFFSSLFEDENTSRAYTEVGRRSTVLTVHADSQASAQRAATIMDKFGAMDVNDRAAQLRKSGDKSAETIPVIEEKLNVGKRVEETAGSVRVKSRIIEKPVEESLRLRNEHVYVERDRVNRPATEADFKNFEEGTFVLKEQREVPVVEKKARVVEEVKVGKEVDQRTEKVRDKVRKTEVDVEHVGTDEDYDARNRRR